MNFIREENTERISTSITPSMKILVDLYARNKGMPVSVFMRQAIQEYLHNHLPDWEEILNKIRSDHAT